MAAESQEILAALRRQRLRRRASKVARDVLSHIVLLLGCVVMAFPFVWMVFSSFKTDAEIFVFPPELLPRAWRWSNYADVMEAFPFATFIFNSLKISLLGVIGQLLSCSLAAYAFARIPFPGREAIFLGWLACLMIPGSVTLIPQFLLFRAFGWLNTHAPLYVPHFFGGAFGSFLLRQFFLAIPRDLEDAATIDGCTRFDSYWRIFMPLAKPALATLGVFIFMGQWNNLIGPVIYLTSREKMTLTIGLAYFRGQYDTAWALLMAGAVISIIPILILYAAAQKYFVQGVVMSGLKG